MNDIKIELSVLDTEGRFNYEYDENTYGADDIVSYGKDNDAPKQFKYCYMNSATLKSVVDGSVNYILGEEVVVNDEGATFKDKVNRNGMTMKDIVAKSALSYQIYGGFAIQVIYNKLGVPVELFPLDFSRCRLNEKGDKVFYSKKNWSKYGTKAEVYDIFNLKKINIEKPTQILYVKGDFTNNVYPLPEWFGAMRDVLTEIEASKYALNSISNGFSARYLINLPDGAGMDNTQREAIVEAIKKKIPNISVEWLMFGTGHMYDTPTRQHDQNVQNVSGSGELMMDFGFNDEDTTSTNDNNADSTGKNINSVKHTRLDNVHNEVKHIDIAKRKVIEIRVYYDDQTFETFVPAKH